MQGGEKNTRGSNDVPYSLEREEGGGSVASPPRSSPSGGER